MTENKLDIALTIQAPQWKTRLRPYKKTVQNVLDSCCHTALVAVSGTKKFEIAVVMADDAFVQDLNNRYRGKNKPTNVLSFPNDDFPADQNLGDIILAFETVEREANEQQKTFRNHAAHLLIHGFLHLLGYDHICEKDAKKMEKLEIKILAGLEIDNPYS